MIISCCCHLRFNTTREEGDGNKLPLPFLLQQHHRRRRQHITNVFFFSASPPQNKTMAHCPRLLLKHREDKTHKKTTKKNQEKGGNLPLSSHSAFSFLAIASTFLLLNFHFKCFLLASSSFQAKGKKTQRKIKP